MKVDWCGKNLSSISSFIVEQGHRASGIEFESLVEVNGQLVAQIEIGIALHEDHWKVGEHLRAVFFG